MIGVTKDVWLGCDTCGYQESPNPREGDDS